MGKGKESKKSQRKGGKQHTHTEPEPAQAGPSTVPKLVVPATPSPSKRRLPVAGSPSPHGTGDKRREDEEAVKILSLPRIRNKLPTSVSKQIQEVFEGNRHGKRNISQLSNLEITATPPPAKQQMIENDRAQAEFMLESTLLAKKTHLANAEAIVKILNEEWYRGTLDFTKDVFDSEMEKVERLITGLNGDIAVIQTSRHELSGRMMDNMNWLQDRENTNWAYLDLLISRYKTPEGARLSLFASRDADSQQRFQKAVLKAYDADDGEVRWCVISGQWHPAQYVRAAHIVGYNVGEPSAQHLFGKSDDKDGHLMSVKNGLPMHEMYEKAFDGAQLIIVPDGDPENGCWKVHCLYESNPKLAISTLPLGSQLDKRSLQFRNDFRPAARYLYFAFAMNLLRRQRHAIPGYWKDQNHVSGSAWATPSSYLRTSTLRVLAHQIGHLTVDEAAVFADDKSAAVVADGKSAAVEDDDMDSPCFSVLRAAINSKSVFAGKGSPTAADDSPTAADDSPTPAPRKGKGREKKRSEEGEEDEEEF